MDVSGDRWLKEVRRGEGAWDSGHGSGSTKWSDAARRGSAVQKFGRGGDVEVEDGLFS